MTKRFWRLARVGVMVMLMALAGSLVSAPAAHAAEAAPDAVAAEAVPDTERAPGDAQITNSAQSVSSFQVCRDWNGDTNGCASGIGTLYPGENTHSKFGWNDADGFFCVS